MKQIKVWPHLTIVAVVIALVAGLAVAFYLKHEQTVEAESLPNAARIQRVDGEVAISDGLANAEATEADPEWTAASVNQPFSVGDRIYTRDNARTSLAFSGRNFARLDPNTSLDVVSLGNRRTQLALRDGSAMFDVGYLEPDELFEVATPNGAVDFQQPGLYNVGFDNDGNVLVSVLSGLARVVGLGGSGEINKGELLTLVGQTAAELALSRLNPDDAGYQVDDYYRYQYGDAYDGRYNDYDAYLNDPYYYDPARHNASYQYASSTIPGLNDLDYYGDWQNVDGYGYAWRPRVDADWVPYQTGSWTNDYPYGPTWVSHEPWGYAPYHYGRWANVGNQWYWVPDAVNTTPAYAPALVAFVPLNDTNQIGWVPLAPGEVYAPRFYDNNWQPRYLTRADIVPAQLINLGIPGAVTVIPVEAFGRDVDRRNLRRLNRNALASLRPTLDPLTLTPLRNAVAHSAWGRGKINLPPGIAKKLRDTRVFVDTDPRESRFRKDLAKSLRVERVSDNDRNRKFKVRDERHGDQNEIARQSNERRQRIDQATEAARGNREAKHDDRAIWRDPRKNDSDQQKAQRKILVRGAQGERVGKRAQEQPQTERPQKRPIQPRVEFKGPPKADPPQPVKKRDVQQDARRQSPAVQKSPAAQKHEAKTRQPQGGDQGGGKGKGKKP